nr:hypothetical protein [Devosia sediminis]
MVADGGERRLFHARKGIYCRVLRRHFYGSHGIDEKCRRAGLGAVSIEPAHFYAGMGDILLVALAVDLDQGDASRAARNGLEMAGNRRQCSLVPHEEIPIRVGHRTTDGAADANEIACLRPHRPACTDAVAAILIRVDHEIDLDRAGGRVDVSYRVGSNAGPLVIRRPDGKSVLAGHRPFRLGDARRWHEELDVQSAGCEALKVLTREADPAHLRAKVQHPRDGHLSKIREDGRIRTIARPFDLQMLAGCKLDEMAGHDTFDIGQSRLVHGSDANAHGIALWPYDRRASEKPDRSTVFCQFYGKLVLGHVVQQLP